MAEVVHTTTKTVKGLYYSNLPDIYPNLGPIKEKYIIGMTSNGTEKPPLLQKNYGLPCDCTLTSLAFIFGEKYYPDIEAIAKTLGYNGETYGTNPITVRTIMTRVMKLAGIKGTAKSAYLKNIGFTWNSLKKLLKANTYILLNLWKDGRGYYNSHSVTIIGYSEYSKHKFLLIYDNWTTTISYLDYDKLSSISSINYYIGGA